VVLSRYFGVNADDSLWVLRCQCRWFSLGNPMSMPWFCLGTPVSTPVVLSGYSGVNALLVIRCQCRWFSLCTLVSMPVVLAGYSGVNAGGSLWVIRCQYR
jgi:hypothetical protein